MPEKTDLSRRGFLKGTGAAAGFIIAGGGILAAGAAGAAADAAHDSNGEKTCGPFRGRMFFTDSLEFQTISEAAERIFPKDKNGPGAIELAVPYFIDNQLAAGFGYNAREYTMGPYYKGAPTQGYQGAMVRRDVFRRGIAALNREANTRYKSDFPDLTDSQKDDVLRVFEAGKADFDGVSSAWFFGLLKSAVLAGVYADPIYSGNNDMQGWIMKRYPGAQMSYKAIIKDAEFQEIEPMSLADMQ